MSSAPCLAIYHDGYKCLESDRNFFEMPPNGVSEKMRIKACRQIFRAELQTDRMPSQISVAVVRDNGHMYQVSISDHDTLERRQGYCGDVFGFA
jgi:hypothetical protein